MGTRSRRAAPGREPELQTGASVRAPGILCECRRDRTGGGVIRDLLLNQVPAILRSSVRLPRTGRRVMRSAVRLGQPRGG